MAVDKRYASVAVVVVIAAAVAVAVATNRPPQGAAAPAPEASVGTIVALTDADRREIEGWRASGFVQRLSEASHEVWVDGEQWRVLPQTRKEAAVRKLSLYFKSLDGTRQVIVHDARSNESLADFFADVLRLQ